MLKRWYEVTTQELPYTEPETLRFKQGYLAALKEVHEFEYEEDA